MGYKDFLKQMGYGVANPMQPKIDEWFGWYTAVNDWYQSSETNAAAKRTYKVERLTIRPARLVCQEWASLLLNERTTVSCEDAATNDWLSAHLEETGFFTHGQRLVERAFALGTGAWALRVEDMLDGARISPDARMVVQRFDARQIIPLTFDEDTCTECAFISKVAIRGRALTQLQVHCKVGGEYVTTTAFFDGRGQQVVVDGIATEFHSGCATPLYALVRPGLENTHCDYSPFGVSVFDDAIGAVKLVDSAVDNMFRDIWLGQKMLFLDERMLEADADGNVQVPRAKDQQLFRKADMDNASKLVEDYNPDLRVSDNRLALQTGFELLGTRTGFGNEYFSIKGASGLKTATEVVAEQGDLFRNVRKHENALAPAIRTILTGIITLARTIKDESLPEDFGTLSVNFDDSVIEDTEAQRKRDLGDVAAQIMQPWEYRAKWYGEDEETARRMVEGDALPPAE
jgi:A118 family predicted phage portal protein